jgi:uncharacterized protein YkwD
VKTTQGLAGALLAALLAGCLHAPPSPAARPATGLDQVMSPESFDHALLAQAIFEASNRVRAANGAPPLARMAALDAAADEQAIYMSLSLAAGHTNPIPGKRDVEERIESQGLHAASVGENAIMMAARRPADEPGGNYTYSSFAARLIKGWMDSPGHREILLARKFTNLGCAARLAHGFIPGDQRVFAAQVFLLPAP